MNFSPRGVDELIDLHVSPDDQVTDRLVTVASESEPGKPIPLTNISNLLASAFITSFTVWPCVKALTAPPPSLITTSGCLSSSSQFSVLLSNVED